MSQTLFYIICFKQFQKVSNLHTFSFEKHLNTYKIHKNKNCSNFKQKHTNKANYFPNNHFEHFPTKSDMLTQPHLKTI